MDRLDLNNNECLIDQDHLLRSINGDFALLSQDSLDDQKEAFYQYCLGEEIRNVAVTSALNQINPNELFTPYNLDTPNKDQKLVSKKITELNN